MNMSLNELTAAFKRAFEGLGFELGDYEDAAQMVVWLEAHGLGGLQEVQRGLPYLIQKACPAPHLSYEDDSLAVIDARNNSVLTCGGQAIDLAYAKARQSGLGIVQLRNSHNRKMIIERLVNCGRRGIACFAYWRNGSGPVTEHVVSVASGEDCPHYSHYSVGDRQFGDKQTLYIVCSDNFGLLKARVNRELCQPSAEGGIMTPEQARTAYAESLEQGIAVNSELLATLDGLIKNILVESTEQSRLGAGD